MVYTVTVERLGKAGTPQGPSLRYEAASEREAIAVATYEVDIGRSGPQRVATVFNPAGVLVLAYAGRATGGRV